MCESGTVETIDASNLAKHFRIVNSMDVMGQRFRKPFPQTTRNFSACIVFFPSPEIKEH